MKCTIASSFALLSQGQILRWKSLLKGRNRFQHALIQSRHTDHGPQCCQAPVSTATSHSTVGELNENVTTLKVGIIPISVLIISVGILSISLAVWDSSKRRMVVETRIEDLVHYFLRILLANVPHGQDGAKGTASDARLLMLLQAKVESGSFIFECAVATEVSSPNL